METLYTTQQAAEAIGCSVWTVRRIAQSREIGRQIGKSLVFSADDIEAMRPHYNPEPGNPEFGKSIVGRKRTS